MNRSAIDSPPPIPSRVKSTRRLPAEKPIPAAQRVECLSPAAAAVRANPPRNHNRSATDNSAPSRCSDGLPELTGK